MAKSETVMLIYIFVIPADQKEIYEQRSKQKERKTRQIHMQQVCEPEKKYLATVERNKERGVLENLRISKYFARTKEDRDIVAFFYLSQMLNKWREGVEEVILLLVLLLLRGRGDVVLIGNSEPVLGLIEDVQDNLDNECDVVVS